MTIQLPADIEASIRQQLERGRFPDVTDVVREAMRLLEERERQLDTLRAKLQVGLDSGEGIPYTPELLDEIDREVDERLRHLQEPRS